MMKTQEKISINALLGHLAGIRKNGTGWTARCPAHQDHKNSLSVKQAEDGRILLFCHAGCSFSDIIGALDIEAKELMGDTPVLVKNTKSRIEKTYDYVDAAGNLLFQAVRFQPKDFKFRQPDGPDKWIWNLKGVEKMIFRLPEVQAAVQFGGYPIFVCEGEKGVLNLETEGLPATCSPGGANKWLKKYADYFIGAEIVILPDNDDPGRKHALLVARSLVGKAASIKILELPGIPEKGDVSD